MTFSAQVKDRPTREAPGRPLQADDDHEQVVVKQDPDTGLRFLIAVHSTVLGPALGGLRLRRYPGGLHEALADVLSLARTMTLKASAAGLDLGGGKAVMLDDGRRDARERRLEQAGEIIESLDGAYITAEDIGTTTEDMEVIARRTRFVVGRAERYGGRGDPSPVTAETVFQAIRRGLAVATGSDELEGRRVGVVGLGKVGLPLAGKLAAADARVIGCDIDSTRVERFVAEHGGEVAPSAQAILGMELDVLAPCAAGGLVDAAIAHSIECNVIAGAANNPLTDREVARVLDGRGILYVPDFLANCGGLIRVSSEWYGDRGRDEADCIARAMERVEAALDEAELSGSTPLEVAEHHALARIEAVRGRLAA